MKNENPTADGAITAGIRRRDSHLGYACLSSNPLGALRSNRRQRAHDDDRTHPEVWEMSLEESEEEGIHVSDPPTIGVDIEFLRADARSLNLLRASDQQLVRDVKKALAATH